jgi:hypothetical protein
VHAHPRFRGLMARVKQDLVRQRAAVLAARSQPRRQGG